MKIFNTLTRKKEELKTIEEGKVKIYACGPTVYNYIHIGNARPLCVFDVLRRYLEYRGYDVRFVQNFTDIDDKIIKRANEEGVSYKDISEKYIEEFWIDAKGLNVREATVHPKATENIDEIITRIDGNSLPLTFSLLKNLLEEEFSIQFHPLFDFSYYSDRFYFSHGKRFCVHPLQMQ